MARPFVFGLERVLEYRRQVEDQAMLALAALKHEILAQSELIDSLERDLQDCLLEMSRLSRMSPAELWLWTGWRERLELDKSQAQTRLIELRRQAEERRRELVLRSKDRKLLEKLRVKQARQHEQEEQHSEQHEFDEAAILRHGRTPC